jgi:hypothetical protein
MAVTTAQEAETVAATAAAAAGLPAPAAISHSFSPSQPSVGSCKDSRAPKRC